MFELFIAASDDVKAALIGNIGVVLAALLTVVGAAFFAGRQYAEERKEKAKDRALQTKKEVMLNGAGGAQKGVGAQASFSDLSKPIAQISAGVQEGIGAMVLASAVANIESVKKGKALIEAIGPLAMEMMRKRMPVEAAKSDYDIAQGQVERVLAENGSISDRFTAATEGGDNSRADYLWEVIQRREGLFGDAMQKQETANQKLMELHAPFIKEAVKTQDTLAPYLHAFIAAVRADVGIEGEASAFIAAMHVDPTRMWEELNKVLDDVKAMADEEQAS